ncbi:hypothetical protein ACGFYQ_36500 [Streptomyces sp. NPDC048258]|uniref:hypothetical protein n=1 Tax=Streptomyces sp. NPDC048258 TaxID=3365527 RepID=UPI003714A96C
MPRREQRRQSIEDFRQSADDDGDHADSPQNPKDEHITQCFELSIRVVEARPIGGEQLDHVSDMVEPTFRRHRNSVQG